MKYLVPLLLGFTFLLASCGPGYDYERQYDFEEAQWRQSDTLNFGFSIADTLTIYNLYLEVEHSTSYNFQNLYTKVYTQFPSGARIEELLSLELAGRAGDWLGDCNSETCILSIPIQEGAYFNQPGDYTVTVKQYMRLDPVAGVRSIKFMLEDTGQKRSGN